MSTRKIVFLIIVGILWLLIVYGIWNLSQKNTKAKATPTKSLSIWVVGDTSEQYQKLFSEFGKWDPAYKSTTLDIRVFPDYEKYQRILLSTLSEGTGPDIFMIEWEGDTILESKSIALPESIVPLTDFDKKYEDIFLPLLISLWAWDQMSRSLKWVPIGYETLGLFYHKSLLRSVPKTWSELETLTLSSEKWPIYTTNLGLSPTYTPTATDLIAYFMGKNGGTSTSKLQWGSEGLSEYLAYATTLSQASSSANDLSWDIQITLPSTLRDTRKEMDVGSLTTVDLFMRGRIAMLVGYPSLIREIEKSEKRAGSEALGDLILTEKLPQDSLGKNRSNLARYRYLAVSKKTDNPDSWAKLLEYLMSDIAHTKATEAFPLLISPLRSRSEWQKTTSLSSVFARARLDAFIPDIQDQIFVFDYGLKWEYEKILREYLDRNDKIDINTIIKLIQKNVSCESESILSGSLSEKCIGNDTP